MVILNDRYWPEDDIENIARAHTVRPRALPPQSVPGAGCDRRAGH
jgi:hypothetical protein